MKVDDKLKKIVFFANDLRLGGIENALVNLLNNIDYSKYDVTLILEKKSGILLDKINPRVHVKEYKIANFKFVIFRKIYNFLKRFLWSLFNKNRYDFSCAYATYSLMGSKLSKIASSNSCLYVHSDYTYLYNKEELLNFFDKRDIVNFNSIVFVSNESRDNLVKYYPMISDKSFVINNFIDIKRIISLSKEHISLNKTHEFLFVFVGRLDEDSKKISRLLNIIKLLKSNYSVELWIIGDGPDKDNYEKFIHDNNLEDNVKMLGAQMNPYPYMKKADYIILTSRYEGFPVIYLEAIALERKIITTIDVSDDFISIPGRFGYVVSNDDSIIVNDIEKIIKNDNLNYEKFDFDNCFSDKINKIEKLFDGVGNEKI